MNLKAWNIAMNQLIQYLLWLSLSRLLRDYKTHFFALYSMRLLRRQSALPAVPRNDTVEKNA